MPIVIRQLAANDAAFQDCFNIRLEVFVLEQNVPADEERDAYDDVALHFLASQHGLALGTARVLVKPDGAAKIGRVAVLQRARGQGVGAALLAAVERELPLAKAFILDAQIHALPFYERLGYAAQGEMFMEAGIPHRHMTKRPPASP